MVRLVESCRMDSAKKMAEVAEAVEIRAQLVAHARDTSADTRDLWNLLAVAEVEAEAEAVDEL